MPHDVSARFRPRLTWLVAPPWRAPAAAWVRAQSIPPERNTIDDVRVFMKVIFLDIDGVLNSDATPNPRKFPYIVDNGLLARFKELVRRAGAKVVLSSTWRVDPVGLLAARHYEVPFDDICPDIPDAPRCEEMQAWLRQNPEVTRYVVLDDDDDCLDELPLFQPSSKTGLTDEIADGIEEFLAGRSDKDMRASAIARLGQNIHALFGRDKS